MCVYRNLESFDEQKCEKFADEMVAKLNAGAMAIMVSIGHRVGLFDELGKLGSFSSEELARNTGLAERYVREWLGVMVTSRVVEYNPQVKSYQLPAEHAAFLTRASSPNNLAATFQFISVMSSVEEQILERFKDGEGLHYHHYDRFHEVMAEDSAQLVVSSLIDAIIPIAPGLVDRLEKGIQVADIGCGGGRALLTLAERFPNSQFLGLDFCEEAFRQSEQQAEKHNIRNVKFRRQDLSKAESIGSFDLITAFDAVHDQADPQGLLALVHRSLAKNGVFLMQEINGSRDLEKNLDHPFSPFLYAISCMHCTPVSLGQGGPGLGTMWGVETAKEYLEHAGFKQIETHRLEHDPMNVYFVATP